MGNEDIAGRLDAIERRLAALELREFGGPRPQELRPPARPSPAAQASSTDPLTTPRTAERSASRPGAVPLPDLAITQMLGWASVLGSAGALALVLAASYLIRLAIHAGWLTPAVQVCAAAVFGILLIGAGFALKRINHRYAGLLPAAGVAILFLAVYGAHLLYHLTSGRGAAGAVIVVCATSLALCAAFESDLYALFAVAASYSAPFLILLALYVALVGFDALAGRQQLIWHELVEFQTVQAVIFAVGVTVFAIRWRAPLDEQAALVHLPALLLFYGLQYLVLKAHVPDAAPWIAIASVLAAALLYVVPRMAFSARLPVVNCSSALTRRSCCSMPDTLSFYLRTPRRGLRWRSSPWHFSFVIDGLSRASDCGRFCSRSRWCSS